MNRRPIAIASACTRDSRRSALAFPETYIDGAKTAFVAGERARRPVGFIDWPADRRHSWLLGRARGLADRLVFLPRKRARP